MQIRTRFPLLLAVLLAGALSACTTPSPGPGATTPVTVSSSPGAGSSTGSGTGSHGTGAPTEPTGSTSPSTSPGATGAEIQVPIYYVAETLPRVGPRLYREFRLVPGLPGGRVATAVDAMLTLPPLDPDYRSAWAAAGVTLRSVSISGAVATVDLSRWLALGAGAESAAVQQLVHTVTAADPAVTSVRLLVGGSAPPSGHLDLSRPISRASALDTLAFVWILEPTQGATSGSPVTVHVYGTGFEGTIPLKVFRGSAEVASTFVTTMMGQMAEARTTIALAPGRYEVRAYNENMESGALELWDSKEFTVR